MQADGAAVDASACDVLPPVDQCHPPVNELLPAVVPGIQTADAHGDFLGPTTSSGLGSVLWIVSSFTVGSGGAGGVLGPALAIGGATGACLGAVCEALFPGVFPEALRQALIPVGMGGVLGATMRVPLAAIVMAVEMTGSYGLIVPTMLVCVVSYVIGRRWGLNAQQVPTSAESPVHAADNIVRLLEATSVADLMDRDWPLVIHPHATLRDIGKHLEPGHHPTFMVVQDGQLQGMISLPDLDRVLADTELCRVVVAHDIMFEHIEPLTPERNLYHALEMFRHVKYAALPVVSLDPSPRFLGVLTRREIFDTLMAHVNGLKEIALREHQMLLAIDEETRLEHLLTPVGGGNGPQIRRLMIPLDAVGRSIREANFRNRYGFQVVAIEQPDGRLQCPADPDASLEASQRLLVIAQSATPP